jgi:hypothetical protein
MDENPYRSPVMHDLRPRARRRITPIKIVVMGIAVWFGFNLTAAAWTFLNRGTL